MKHLTIAGMILMIILAGCKTKPSEEQEIEKLLDRQVQLQESQSETVDQLQHIKDSLAKEKQTLMLQRESKDEQIKLLEENRQILAERLREEEESAVVSEKSELEDRMSAYEDSIRQLKDELTGLNSSLDSIEKSIDFYEMQEGRTEQTLESGISEIDQRISMRENRKQQEIKRADLLRRRIQVADKKIEAYQMERQMYADERDELLRINAAEEELQPYRDRIVEMDSIIKAEKKNKQELDTELRNIEQWVAETDSVMEDLRAQIRLEYDKKAIIENFIISEKERLRRELENIELARQNLLEEQDKVSQDLTNTQEQVASLDKQIELIKNKEMSDILEQQAAIEQTEARLAEEEIRLLEEGTGAEMPAAGTVSDSVSEDLRTLLSMGSQLDSLNDLIQEEKAEIARTRKELSERRAEAAQQRARFGRTMGIVILIIVIGGIALLALFYYLGKRARK